MKLEELIKIIESYGADVNRWPEEKSSDAMQLLQNSSEAQSALLEARKLDDLLTYYVVADADDLLSHKIVYENTQINNPGIPSIFSSLFRPSYAMVAMLLFCLLLGLSLGFLDVFLSSQQLSANEAETLLLGPIETLVI